MRYLDVTREFLKKATPNSHKIKFNNKTFIDNKTNIKYIVDGKHIKFNPSKKEIEIAEWIEGILGGKIEINPKISEPAKIRVPDYYYKGMRLDLKDINGNGKNTLDTALKSKKEQADNFIFDITEKCKLDNQKILKQIERIYNSSNRDWVNMIFLRRKKQLLKIYLRKYKK